MVELLEGVAVGLVAAQVLHDRDHRDRRLERLGEPGNEQGRRRTVLGGDHPHLVADPGVAVGHCGAGVLGAVADLADAELGRGEVQLRGQALAEHDLDAVARERLDEAMGDGGVAGHGGSAARDPIGQSAAGYQDRSARQATRRAAGADRNHTPVHA